MVTTFVCITRPEKVKKKPFPQHTAVFKKKKEKKMYNQMVNQIVPLKGGKF